MIHAFEIITATTQRSDPPRVPTPAPPTVQSVMPERMAQAVGGLGEKGGQSAEVLTEQAVPIREIAEHESEQKDGQGKSVIVPAHMRGLYRVVATEKKSEAIAVIEEKLADLAWYRVRYHECHHDEGGDNKPCSKWEIVAEYGEVPEGVE